jgi:hypothetical protein
MLNRSCNYIIRLSILVYIFFVKKASRIRNQSERFRLQNSHLRRACVPPLRRCRRTAASPSTASRRSASGLPIRPAAPDHRCQEEAKRDTMQIRQLDYTNMNHHFFLLEKCRVKPWRDSISRPITRQASTIPLHRQRRQGVFWPLYPIILDRFTSM